MDYTSLKKQLRKQFREARMALTEADALARSEEIFRHWSAAFDMRKLHAVHVFLTLRRFREVETHFFTEFILRECPWMETIVPVTDGQAPDGPLRHALLAKDVTLKLSPWGIPEPQMPVRWAAPTLPDMVLVPLLAFDAAGNRLGYGKGHYDRFLAETRPDCLRVGLCFETGRSASLLPAEPTDMPLDCVITEKGITAFRNPIPGLHV